MPGKPDIGNRVSYPCDTIKQKSRYLGMS